MDKREWRTGRGEEGGVFHRGLRCKQVELLYRVIPWVVYLFPPNKSIKEERRRRRVGGVPLCAGLTDADEVHESVHGVADLEEQVLALPLGRGAEGRPDEPGDAGDEKQGAQDDGSDLDLLDHRQGDGLPLNRTDTRAKKGTVRKGKQSNE